MDFELLHPPYARAGKTSPFGYIASTGRSRRAIAAPVSLLLKCPSIVLPKNTLTAVRCGAHNGVPTAGWSRSVVRSAFPCRSRVSARPLSPLTSHFRFARIYRSHRTRHVPSQRYELGLPPCMATGEERMLNKRIEIEVVHREGHLFLVEHRVSPIHSDGSMASTAFCIINWTT
jgi:hypothetical protein